MKYATSHNVQQLTIYVGPGLIKHLELPPSIFHCHSLTALKLDFRHPHSHDYSENGCAEPFSTCKMLSTLVIFCCCLQDDAKALCISNSNLSCLVIVCNLPFLERANLDHGYDDNPFKESLLIDWLHLLANVKIMSISHRTLCQIHNFQKRYPTRGIVPCFVRLESLKVVFRSDDSQIFDEIIRGKVKEMVTCLLQNSLHAKVDIILKTESPRAILIMHHYWW
ncbi:F-box family-3 protein [Trifolium pratense]|uniref:F-box family-3 protein n=1 Tax=Trifolium pratense TaxID=57577 RepID=A0A2K3L3S9_TRIPR|nr:F-box family-3 protein [Trifolium pratense]